MLKWYYNKLDINNLKQLDFEGIFCYPCYVPCCKFLPILMFSRSFFPNFAGKSPVKRSIDKQKFLVVNCDYFIPISFIITGICFGCSKQHNRQSQLQQMTNFATSYLVSEKIKVYFMGIHEISCLICYF